MTTVLIIIVAIILLLLTLHFMAGKEMVIERSITISKPSDELFKYLVLVKNQDHFSVWNMQDPTMKKNYKGKDGEIGFIYSWDSSKNKNVGAGEQEIIGIEKGKSIDFELRFKRPMQSVARSRFEICKTGTDLSTVKWGFYSPTRFPMSIMTPVFKKLLGKDLQKGLHNLKNELEKQ